MASASLIKDRGFLLLLLVGLLLPAVFVSGVATTNSTMTSAANATTANSTWQSNVTYAQPTTSGVQRWVPKLALGYQNFENPPALVAHHPPPSTASTTSRVTTTTTDSQSSSISGGPASIITQSSTTGGTIVATSTQSSTRTTYGGFTTSVTSANSQSSTSASSGATVVITTQIPHHPMTQSGNGSTSTGWTTPSAPTTMMTTGGMTTMDMANAIYCPSFVCNYTNCYSMYDSQNATCCAPGSYCQLSKQMDMSYIANCSASCGDQCVNDTQMNCCVGCCNTTGCLNDTFASMMMTTTTTVPTTVMTTTTSTTTTTTTTTAAPGTTTIAPDNGNKCHTGTCDGDTCYTNFNTFQTCTDAQQHCQLKKESGASALKWTAGCTSDCSQETTCQGKTTPPCHLECCNSTQTSCLLLNGELNVFSFATRGPYLHTELTASLLCLLAVAMML